MQMLCQQLLYIKPNEGACCKYIHFIAAASATSSIVIAAWYFTVLFRSTRAAHEYFCWDKSVKLIGYFQKILNVRKTKSKRLQPLK